MTERYRHSHGLKPPGRFQRAVTGVTRRLERHIIPLGLLVTAIGLFMAYIAWSSVNGVPFQDRYQLKALMPKDAPILQTGDAVRIAGRLAGLITDVKPHKGATEVEMELRPSFAPVGRDARAKVRVKSLIYLTYLELHPGDIDDPMPEGSTIPLKRTGSNVDLLEVVQLFDRETRETLKRTLFDTGVGLAGRGAELNVALADLRSIARHGTSQLEALTSEPGAIAEGLRSTRAVARGLKGERPDDIEATLESGGAVVGALGRRGEELGESIDLLRPLEDEFLATAPLADPVLDDATALSVELAPVADELTAALPDLNRVLASGDEIRRETARLTGFLRPAIRAAIPVLEGLRPVVAMVDPILHPLNRLVGVLKPYAGDITTSAAGLISATETRYLEGETARRTGRANPALRFSPVLTCHRNRNPYPAPGQTKGQGAPC